MTRNKKPPSSSAQLSFARELFAAPPGEAQIAVPPPAVDNDRAGTALNLPTNLNSFAYSLHILQDSIVFRRAVIWKVLCWALRSGVIGFSLSKLLFG